MADKKASKKKDVDVNPSPVEKPKANVDVLTDKHGMQWKVDGDGNKIERV